MRATKGEGTSVTDIIGPREVWLTFAPAAPERVLEEVRRELKRDGPRVLHVNLEQAAYLDPAALRTLTEATAAARAAGVVLRYEGARPPVHKALHLAKGGTP